MRSFASVMVLVGLAGCASAQTSDSTVRGPRPPAPAPSATDGIDDNALHAFAADVDGRSGDDQSRAQVRLVTAQTRAFVVAVVHALPPIADPHPAAATGDGGTATPRFDPPATLIQQLGATNECSSGGVAHGCAARLGNTLLQRIDALRPPADLVAVKAGLQSSLAALEESRVVIDTGTRARVLATGEDVAASLAQAVTLLQIKRHVAQAIAIDCPCDESAHLAARLSDELALGVCSDAYEQLLGTDGAATHSAEGLRALAGAGCVPECARTGLGGNGEDPVLEAARACRGEADAVFAPFADATHSLATWSSTAATRLAARTNDVAVNAVLAAAPAIPENGSLPMPPALFVAGGGRTVDVPPVSGATGSGVELGEASVVVWMPAEGDVWVRSARQFSLTPTAPTEGRAVPLTSIAAAVDQVAPASERRQPVAIVVDREARAPRFLAALGNIPRHEAAAGASSAPTDGVVAFAVRNGAFSRYIPMRVVPTASGNYLRVGERQITVVTGDNVAQIVTLSAPPASGADLLGGALTDAAPATVPSVVFESDASGSTIARVLDALAVHVGRAAHPEAPRVVLAPGEGALTVNVTDAARATALRAAVDAHRAEAIRCLEARPADALNVARVDVHLVLDARGRVTRADTATHDAPHLEPVVACLAPRLRAWRLPAPGVANAEIHVAYVHERNAAPAASAAPTTSSAPPAGHGRAAAVRPARPVNVPNAARPATH